MIYSSEVRYLTMRGNLMAFADPEVVRATPPSDQSAAIQSPTPQALPPQPPPPASTPEKTTSEYPAFDRSIPSLGNVMADIPLQEQQLSHDRTNRTLAMTVTVGFFALIAAVFGLTLVAHDLSPTANLVLNLLFTLLGVVATGWITIINFQFGSSASSAQKSATINTALTKAMSDKSAT